MNGAAGLGFTRHTRTVGSAAREEVESSGAARPLNTGRTGRMGSGARADLSSVFVTAICTASALGPRLGSRPPREISRSYVNVDPRYQRCRPQMADASFAAILDQTLTLR